MKKVIICLFFLSFFESCKETPILDSNQEKQIYLLLNTLVLDSLFKPDVVVREAMMYSEPKEYRDQPASIGVITSSNHFFNNSLVNTHVIDSADLNFIREQIKEEQQYFWDPSKLKYPSINRDVINSIFKDKGKASWDYLYDHYKIRSFLTISFPLFSKDMKTIFLSVEIYCGGLCGEQHFYIFKEIDGKWQIFYSEQGWVS